MDAARRDFQEPQYVRECASRILASLAPDYRQPSPLEFALRENDGYYHISTNVDFVTANEVYHRTVPASHSSLSSAQVLLMILEAREHLSLAASLDAELLVSPTRSTLIGLRMESLLDRVGASGEQLAHFQELAFSDAHAVREAFCAGGGRSISDLLPLLDSARRWKAWLAERPADGDLLREYWAAAFAHSWLNSLPANVARWVVFTGIGVGVDLAGAGGLGTALGVGVSVADATIVQRVVSGWKPHQFVEGPLRKLLAPNSGPVQA